jgi:hypothetical protein
VSHRAIPSTCRRPIMWAGGGNMLETARPVMPTLPPPGHVIAVVKVGGMAR